jgi:hypothetical protein
MSALLDIEQRVPSKKGGSQAEAKERIWIKQWERILHGQEPWDNDIQPLGLKFYIKRKLFRAAGSMFSAFLHFLKSGIPAISRILGSHPS